MRKLIIIVFVFAVSCFVSLTLGSCHGNGHTGNTDSTSVDSLSGMGVDDIFSEMPKAADDLFDDFFFNFASSKTIQNSRIAFPLPVKGDAHRKQIEKREWKYDQFYIHKDYYTILSNNMEEVGLSKDTTVNTALLERIDLAKKSIVRYLFERRHHQWMLSGIEHQGFDHNANGAFLSFYSRFVTDDAFQQKSICDPMEFSGPDPDDELATMEGMILPEQFPSFAPPLPKKVIYNVIYGTPTPEKSDKILVIRGVSNGFEAQLQFKKRGGQWYLSKLTM